MHLCLKGMEKKMSTSNHIGSIKCKSGLVRAAHRPPSSVEERKIKAQEFPGIFLILTMKQAKENSDHRPGILVGICSEHLHSHQDRLVGTDI